MVESLIGIGSASNGRRQDQGPSNRTLKEYITVRLRGTGPVGGHVVYFFCLCVVSSVLFYFAGRRAGASDDALGEKMGLLDAVFLSVTSATGAGLNNVVLSKLNTFQQLLVFLLILLGSQTWVAACVVNIQRITASHRMLKRCHREVEEKDNLNISKKIPSLIPKIHVSPQSSGFNQNLERITPGDSALQETKAAGPSSQSPTVDAAIEDDDGIDSEGSGNRVSPARSSGCIKNSDENTFGYLALKGTPAAGASPQCSTVEVAIEDDGVNSEKVTHSTLFTLSWLVPSYLLIFQALGSIILGGWMASYGQHIVGPNGIHPWWWGIFSSVSAFNNSGLSLLDANMTPFQTEGSLVVWTHCILILAGNSGFPLFLKVTFCMLRKVFGLRIGITDSSPGSKRIFPYLFPQKETYWLISMLFILNGIDFLAAATGNSNSLNHLPVNRLLLACLLEALSVRSGGFTIFLIRDLHVGVQLIFTIMLYVSAFPLCGNPLISPQTESNVDFVKRQLHGLLRAGDLRYLSAAVGLICVFEAESAQGVFPVIFEVASAFGCVGISFGAVRSDSRLALVGDWKGISKIILGMVMIWGRIREVRRGILKEWWHLKPTPNLAENEVVCTNVKNA